MKNYVMAAMGFLIAAAGSQQVQAQKKGFDYKFYGQVRTDLYYNSRANEETVDGLFYMYPKDKVYDNDGHDLNATANGSFYTLYSRLGVDVEGPQVGKAQTSAKVEVDFRGSGTSYSTIRLRHAYLNLDWGSSALLIGQTWHPLYGDVAPQILNLNMGAPFQPFSRAPQARYRFEKKGWMLTGALVWQSQYLSQGPAGKSQEYIKKSGVPEVYASVDYKKNGWQAGAGVEMLSLVPRTQAVGDDGTTYKVGERLTTLSAEAHVKYTGHDWFVAGKTLLGSNLTQASGLGGFGIKEINERTGEQKYTPIRVSTTWVNIVYGKKWKPGLFVGYAKNLGTPHRLVPGSSLYGTGTNLDQLAMGSAELTYNLPHWKFGVEYSLASAWYGTVRPKDGRVEHTHAVCNNRFVCTAIFMF